jgi:hypothetical protein
MAEMYDPGNLTRGIDAMIAQTTNARHLAILRNYRRHAILEVTGNWEQILTPEMTVTHPHYRITERGQTLVLDGIEQVSAFYATIAESGLAPLFGPIRERFMVGDWGLSSHGLWGHQLPGPVAVEQGIEVDDPDAFYYLTHWYASVWLYDEHCKLIGEHIFEDTGSRQSWKMDPADVISLDEAYARVQPYLDEELSARAPTS